MSDTESALSNPSDKPARKGYGPAEVVAAVLGGGVGFYGSESLSGAEDRLAERSKDMSTRTYIKANPFPTTASENQNWKKGYEEVADKEFKFSQGDILRETKTWEKVFIGASILGAAWGAAKLVNHYRNRDNDKSSGQRTP